MNTKLAGKRREHKDIAAGVVHNVPADLREALIASPAALAAWENIMPLARNEWICWTISVKNPEMRTSLH